MTASFIPSLLKELDDITITTPAVGHGIRYDGSKWINQQLSHLDLTNVGVNTHAQIDTHLASAANPHGTTLTQTNLNLTGSFDISNTAPAITLTDTTANAKSLKISVDADIAQIREKVGASGSLLTLDLANNRVGIGTAAPRQSLEMLTPSARFLLVATGGGSPGLLFDDNGGAGAASILFNSAVGGEINFSTGGVSTNRMTISVSGSVGVGTVSPAGTALVDFTSTSKGMLVPRMATTQRDAITAPATGLLIYNTTTNKFNFYNGTAWEAITSA